MSTRLVTFEINGKKISTQYDRTKLRLGTIVFVRFSEGKEPIAISPQSSDGTVPYAVRWIAPSTWHVELVSEFKVRPEFAKRVEDEIGEYITRREIDTALTVFSNRVRIQHFYKTSELGNNPLSVVFTVLERLHVCRCLQQEPVRKALFGYDEPLISYLYLTCFDRLGQPADWLDFSSWLKSSGHKDEREAAKAQAARSGDTIDAANALYRQYLDLYGVKSSFFRFLHEILPPHIRNELLRTIDMHSLSNPPDLTEYRDPSDIEKENYLFRRRNEYTHRADLKAPAGEWLGRSYSNPIQEFYADHWTTIRTIGWPSILNKAVQAGLAVYLLAAQVNEK